MSDRQIRCVEMMRAIRDEIAAEEAGLTWEQRREKLRREVESSELFRRLFGARPATEEGAASPDDRSSPTDTP